MSNFCSQIQITCISSFVCMNVCLSLSLCVCVCVCVFLSPSLCVCGSPFIFVCGCVSFTLYMCVCIYLSYSCLFVPLSVSHCLSLPPLFFYLSFYLFLSQWEQQFVFFCFRRCLVFIIASYCWQSKNCFGH